MSGFGGFGGFGSNANSQSQPNTFGGFGSNAGTSSGFGNPNPGFGTTNTNIGTNMFGASNTTGGGFGSGGFGANTGTSAFGQNKTGFGSTPATSSTSLFGGGTATAGTGFGGGGFGSGATPFGAGNANTGSLFGQSKPAFGTSTTTGTTGGMFGSNGSTAFGSGAVTSTPAFGAAASTSFGNTPAQNNGTATTPFSEHIEKDPAAANTSNRYQTISAMPSYQSFSLEELRLADYAQGRKQGNQNGQAGAFGASTGFGGFGSTATTGGFGSSNTATGGGMFGNTTGQATSSFGQQQNTSTGFGSATTGGGLFGAKPATTGLFGNTATSSGQASGGLFGTSTPSFGGGAATGFGNNASTTGGIFGAAAAKPAFGGFGASTGTAFGTGASSSTGGGNLFGGGAAAPTTGFGGQQQPAAAPFNFAQQGQQATPQAQTGGLFGGGFGAQNQQPKPSIFGNTTTGTTGGLFGQQPAQQQQSTAGGLFGSSTQQQQGGGLFGSKPASGLFGNTGTGTSGGLFGNTQPQQAQTGGLFGQSTQQQSSGLFGAKPVAAAGGLGSSLFNQPQQQQQTGGLFGNIQQQPQLGGSLFGSTQAQQQQQQPQTLHASINENPYGNDSLFASLATPTRPIGPLATPLSTSQASRKQAIIPSWKINPSASTRLITPQKKPSSYGFSYSNYGTPGSAVSSPTGGSLLGGGLNRSLNKSVSTSNLRHSFSAQDSILLPGAFTSTARRGGSSMKKLTVNPNMNVRRPLFAPDERVSSSVVKKSVSFDSGAINGRQDGDASTPAQAGSNNGQLVRIESSDVEATSPGHFHGAVLMPTVEQVHGVGRGKELAVVHEDGPASAPPVREMLPPDQTDKEPGAYWTKPSLDEIRTWSERDKQNVKNFVVGRHGCGYINFSKVNLNEVQLDQICGKIVDLEIRSATVYGDKSKVTKPPPGKGLNVPSVIELDNSWPRVNEGSTRVLEKKGPRFEKHIRRLKRLKDTTFISYNSQTGQWKFSVEHFTTYALDYEDDEDESMVDTSMVDTSALTPVPGTPTSAKQLQTSRGLTSPPLNSDSSLPSPPESSPDDTFDFKKGKRKNLPGQFDERIMYDEDMGAEFEELDESTHSFLDERSVGSLGEDGDEAMSQVSESGFGGDRDMAGSFPPPIDTTEQPVSSQTHSKDAPPPKSILKTSQEPRPFRTPLKMGDLTFSADWTEQLLRTASPKKQDRQALRENQASAFKQFGEGNEVTPKVSRLDKPFSNSMDIMNALFSQSKGVTSGRFAKFNASTKGFPTSQAKRTKIATAVDATTPQDDSFHLTTKPRWGPDGTLVYTAASASNRLQEGILVNFGTSLVGAHTDVRFAKLSTLGSLPSEALAEQQACTEISLHNVAPYATTLDDFQFAHFAEAVSPESISGLNEKLVWELSNILFDNVVIPTHNKLEIEKEYELRYRKDCLSTMWKKLVYADAQRAASRSSSREESALHYLFGGMIEEACGELLEGGNFHLATLVAQIGGDETFRHTVSSQLDSWRELNLLSEFSDEIRTMYELLAGTTGVCRGSTGPGIENRVSEFTISSRFNLDWRRTFGLRLWYGIEVSHDLSEAVKQLAEDFVSGVEQVKPLPWFTAQNVDMGWTDPDPSSRKDALWSLLQLYSGTDNAPVESMFAPENVSGNPMNARLSFQLVNLFRARGRGVSDQTSAGADLLAATYASSLATTIPAHPQALHTTCWVLMHVSNAQSRAQSIRAVFDQYMPSLEASKEKVVADLTSLRIPIAWMHLSKALHARAVTHDAVAEAQSLIEAQHWLEAHEVVCKVIGPQAVIEQNSDQLRELLGVLVEEKEANRIVWNKGAGLYYDYIEMKDLERQRGQKWKELVGRLGRALQSVMSDGLQGRDLTERAALQMMGAEVARLAANSKGSGYGEGLGKVEGLRLPLTEDAYLQLSRTLALNYFKAVLSDR